MLIKRLLRLCSHLTSQYLLPSFFVSDNVYQGNKEQLFKMKHLVLLLLQLLGHSSSLINYVKPSDSVTIIYYPYGNTIYLSTFSLFTACLS